MSELNQPLSELVISVPARVKTKLTVRAKPVEVWKQYNNGRYQVSNFGNVKRDGLPQITYFDKGYERFNMQEYGESRRIVKVHRLVAELFCEGRSDIRCTVDHIDNRDKTNNCWTNLRWASQLEQQNNKRGNKSDGLRGSIYQTRPPYLPGYRLIFYHIEYFEGCICKYFKDRQAAEDHLTHLRLMYPEPEDV